jgi:2-(1,2-epoxy-1,2-dihydrophenyl)acetyl-CoA isomerase
VVSDTVLISASEGVATITLNRPEALNSLTTELKESLLDALLQVAADPAARAVVLTGSGRGFSAGQDLREHGEMLAGGDPAPLHTVERHFNPIVLALATMPKPVIAAVNGIAAGAGASLTFAADFRIAADNAKFLLAFANVGLGLDTGASWTLPRLIGHARATALAILAEPVSASAALEMGLVNAVVPAGELESAVFELAARLAAGPTAAYAAIKEALAYAAAAPLASALEKEAQLQNALGASPDHREATAAFLRKEKPVFRGR